MLLRFTGTVGTYSSATWANEVSKIVVILSVDHHCKEKTLSTMRFQVRWKLSSNEIQKSHVLFQTWTTVLPCQCSLLPTSGKHNSSYTLTFVLGPVSISSFLLLGLSPFPHSPILSNFHTNLPNKLPLHNLSQTCSHPPKKSFFQLSTSRPLYMWGRQGNTSPQGRNEHHAKGDKCQAPTTGRDIN